MRTDKSLRGSDTGYYATLLPFLRLYALLAPVSKMGADVNSGQKIARCLLHFNKSKEIAASSFTLPPELEAEPALDFFIT